MKFLAIILLILFVLPVLYGLAPAPLSVRLDRVSSKFETYDVSFPQFPSFDQQYVDSGGNGITQFFRSIVEGVRTIVRCTSQSWWLRYLLLVS